jgi:hypothetical protein
LETDDSALLDNLLNSDGDGSMNQQTGDTEEDKESQSEDEGNRNIQGIVGNAIEQGDDLDQPVNVADFDKKMADGMVVDSLSVIDDDLALLDDILGEDDNETGLRVHIVEKSKVRQLEKGNTRLQG